MSVTIMLNSRMVCGICRLVRYSDILCNRERYEKEFKQSPTALHSLYGAVTDLYIDYHKFKGRDVRSKAGGIEQCLMDYHLETLIANFGIDRDDSEEE